MHEDFAFKIVHEVPDTVEKMAEQNFHRGIVAGIERILDFEQDLTDWKANNK